VLLQELGEPLVDDRLDEALDRRIAELRLRLPLELRVPQLHRDDRGEPFADVLALEVVLLLLEQALLARVPVERAGEGRAEAGEMRAALGRVDVVREGEDRLDVRGVPLQRDLDLSVFVLAVEVDDVLVDRVLARVDIPDEVADAALVVELVGAAVGPLVAEDNPQAARQEGRLAQALGERRGGELGLVEDLAVWEEGDRRPRLLRRPRHLDVGLGDTALELLPMHLAVAADLGDEPLREGVDHGDADAVEAAGDLVAVASELAAGVELGEDDGQRGEALLLHDVDRDPAAGVAHGDRVVGVDRHVDELVVARERLVDGVVDGLVDEVVEPTRAGGADVHPRTQAYGLEALEDRDVLSGVGGFGHNPPEREKACKTGVLRAC
jgi:hypothetical protein